MKRTTTHTHPHRYVAKRNLRTNEAIIGAFTLSGVDWGAATVTGEHSSVWNAIMDVLLDTVFVHAEVYQYAEPFIQPILTQVVGNIAAQFARVVRSLEGLGPSGASQGLLYTLFVERTLEAYQTRSSRRLMRSAVTELEAAFDDDTEPEQQRSSRRRSSSSSTGRTGVSLSDAHAEVNGVLEERLLWTRVLFECFRH